ncbi:HWE histidine kinase domain-containing protein [Mesorhizobium sp. BE184]|uniref:sensor histidine kinase n=1 Tax=Mesorhizobium sp. BE184 TaxID=2817714 RepID=UPI00286586C9|nr:HWE histidine kinase domain-containing protein [Mesorhizobium sp. BE184]MDR7034079.1 two-component sensor histidine kinase [Mesorhizobium sp. BE184]
MLGRAMMHALRNAGVSVLYQDPELKAVWARNMRAPWMTEDEDRSILSPSQNEQILTSRRAVVANGQSERFELTVVADDRVRWFEVWVDADLDETGKIQGVITTKIETTEQKQREQTLKVLLREVSHRSKNLLAIIQSIATQTGRYSETISDFLGRFRGRLQSLASSQDLVTSSNWRGAELRELVTGQVGRYGFDPARALRFQGMNPYINPNATLHIGLAMHELAVNSVSYGALSQPEGFVEISADFEAEGEGRILVLTWREAISAGDSVRNERRFGSVALERVVPASLNGSATLDISNDRLEYRLVVPHGNFEAA